MGRGSARRPDHDQEALMAQNTSSAVMQQRSEPDDSLDDFPPQPWATRALLEHVIIPQMGMNGRNHVASMSVWEPACNRGHMTKPLREYFRRVYASDIFDYSEHGDWCQDRVVDFLWPGSESPAMTAQGKRRAGADGKINDGRNRGREISQRWVDEKDRRSLGSAVAAS